MARIFKNSIGVRIVLSCSKDLTDLSTATIVGKKSNGVTEISWTATADTPATAGKIYYDTVAGDLNLVGTYTVQAKLVYDVGDTFYGEETTFQVSELSNA